MTCLFILNDPPPAWCEPTLQIPPNQLTLVAGGGIIGGVERRWEYVDS